MVVASFLFATMGVCVKLASAHYTPGEIIFYRGLTGAVLMLVLARGDDETGPYQSPMEDGMQQFHEWYRRAMGSKLAG